jgi:hypothetical protein
LSVTHHRSPHYHIILLLGKKREGNYDADTVDHSISGRSYRRIDREPTVIESVAARVQTSPRSV